MAQLERRLSRLEQQVQPEEAQKQRTPKRPGRGETLVGKEPSAPEGLGFYVSLLCPALPKTRRSAGRTMKQSTRRRCPRTTTRRWCLGPTMRCWRLEFRLARESAASNRACGECITCVSACADAGVLHRRAQEINNQMWLELIESEGTWDAPNRDLTVCGSV